MKLYFALFVQFSAAKRLNISLETNIICFYVFISLEYFKRIVNKNTGKSTLFDHPIKKFININVEEYDYISDDGYWFTKRNFG